MEHYYSFFYTPTTAQLFWLCVLLALLISDLMLLLFVYLRGVLRNPEARASSSSPAISLILCVRDKFEQLKESLPLFLAQSYPNLQVIVVNDNPQDEVALFLKSLQQNHQNLEVTTVPSLNERIPARNLAISMGIKAAASEWIILTEPDARPHDREWVSTLARQMDPRTDFVLGTCRLIHSKSAPMQLVRARHTMSSIQRLGWANISGPYVGERHNCAFRRELFFKARGFAGYNHLLYGEIELFVMRNARRGHVRANFRPEAQTEWILPTEADSVKRERRFMRQAWRAYSLRAKLTLKSETILRCALWILLPLSLFWPTPWTVLALLALLTRRLLFSVIAIICKIRLRASASFILLWGYDLLSPFLLARPSRSRAPSNSYSAWR